jgi:hypothetical protein
MRNAAVGRCLVDGACSLFPNCQSENIGTQIVGINAHVGVEFGVIKDDDVK